MILGGPGLESLEGLAWKAWRAWLGGPGRLLGGIPYGKKWAFDHRAKLSKLNAAPPSPVREYWGGLACEKPGMNWMDAQCHRNSLFMAGMGMAQLTK